MCNSHVASAGDKSTGGGESTCIAGVDDNRAALMAVGPCVLPPHLLRVDLPRDERPSEALEQLLGLGAVLDAAGKPVCEHDPRAPDAAANPKQLHRRRLGQIHQQRLHNENGTIALPHRT